MVRLNYAKNEKIEIYAKLEGVNPGGSIKDRIALSMIENAERSGKLTKDKILLEASSGNTGIAIAMIGAIKGYSVKIVLPESVSIERIKMLRAYDAEIVLTKRELGIDGAILQVKSMLKNNPGRHFSLDQYSNEHNPLVHYEKTAKEILGQMEHNLDYFVAGVGTGGTVTGIGKALKEALPNVKIIAVQPQKNHKIQGLKNLEESLIPKVYSKKHIDRTIVVRNEDAFSTARWLASNQGLLVGMSSGAAMYAGLEIASSIKSGRIGIIFPDRGEKYLSTELFSHCQYQ